MERSRTLARRSACRLVVASIASLVVSPALAQQANRIELRQVEAMFAQMRARAPWNVDGPLLWGYFFLDPEAEKLKRLANELVSGGYRLVGISEVSGRKLWRLHVERIETHSPQSLHERNGALYSLAAKYQVASYDGMDVGPPPK